VATPTVSRPAASSLVNASTTTRPAPKQQPDTDPVPGDRVGGEDGQVAGDVGREQAAQPQEADHVGAASDHAE
jgi:hypothetical protein